MSSTDYNIFASENLSKVKEANRIVIHWTWLGSDYFRSFKRLKSFSFIVSFASSLKINYNVYTQIMIKIFLKITLGIASLFLLYFPTIVALYKLGIFDVVTVQSYVYSGIFSLIVVLWIVAVLWAQFEIYNLLTSGSKRVLIENPILRHALISKNLITEESNFYKTIINCIEKAKAVHIVTCDIEKWLKLSLNLDTFYKKPLALSFLEDIEPEFSIKSKKDNRTLKRIIVIKDSLFLPGINFTAKEKREKRHSKLFLIKSLEGLRLEEETIDGNQGKIITSIYRVEQGIDLTFENVDNTYQRLMHRYIISTKKGFKYSLSLKTFKWWERVGNDCHNSFSNYDIKDEKHKWWRLDKKENFSLLVPKLYNSDKKEVEKELEEVIKMQSASMTIDEYIEEIKNL